MRKRKKGKFARKRNILIRVNNYERKAAEESAAAERKNLSEFFMDLLKGHKTNWNVNFYTSLTRRYEKLLKKYKELLKKYQE